MALEDRRRAEITATLDETGNVLAMHRRAVVQVVRDGEVIATEATAAVPLSIADLIATLSADDFAKVEAASAARNQLAE